MATNELKCKRRLAVTDVNLEDDLKQLYTIFEFVKPNLLGPLKDFNQMYMIPINKSKQDGATLELKSIGDGRKKQLNAITCQFYLRRTSEMVQD